MLKIYSSLFLLLVSIITLCCRSEQVDPPTLAPPDVYLTGTSLMNGGKNQPKYWKNDVEVVLSGPAINVSLLQTFGIAVYNGDVHVVGIGSRTGTSDTFGVYWKNGIITNVSNTRRPSAFYDITVIDGDVYIAGSIYEDSQGATRPVYWKNGEPVVGNEKDHGAMYGIFVSGNNVYTAGSTQTVNGTSAKYWKNGIEMNLPTTRNFTSATSIAVSDSDVHISGYEFTPSNLFIAKYWKNGVESNLSDEKENAITRDIAISGNDVYVLGEKNMGTTPRAVIWKNGVLNTTLDAARAASIAVINNDTYVAAPALPCNTCVPGYFVNNTKFSVPFTQNSTMLSSIFVTNP